MPLAAEKDAYSERQHHGLERDDDGLHMPDSYSEFPVMTGGNLLGA